MRLPAFLVPLLIVALSSCSRYVEPVNTNSSVPRAITPRASQPASRKPCLDLNAATTEDLERLPGIGEMTAHKIVAYREQNGPFRRPEELIIIEGFSERKYRSIADLVCVN